MDDRKNELDVNKMIHEMTQTICGQRITMGLLFMVGGILFFTHWIVDGLSCFRDGKILSGCFSVVMCTFWVYICVDSVRKIVVAIKLKKEEQYLYDKLVNENSCDSNIT